MLELSRITLGTMRFADKDLSVQDVAGLIQAAADAGVTTHHSSSEYSSYDLYVKALRSVQRRSNIRHIVKVAAPHFEDDGLCVATLEQRVDQQLQSLGIDCIDVLQWLLRSKPINDTARLGTLNTHRDEIEQVFADLKRKGKIKSVHSFPYSVEFARRVLELDAVDGLTAYLNNQEQDYAEFADAAVDDGSFIAIRPLFAGQMLANVESIEAKNEVISECMRFVFARKAVSSAIVGINSVEQLNAFRCFV